MSEERRTSSRRALLQAASMTVLGRSRSMEWGQEKFRGVGLPLDLVTTEDRNENRSLPRRRLGRTNMMVTTIGAGGAGITGSEILQRAVEKGINYIDTAPDYGHSEEIFGEVMQTSRDQVFLATKWAVMGDWTVAQCLDSLHRSLKRLKTDHIDLLQLHSVDTGPGLVGTPRDGYARMSNSNLHQAMEKARDAGKVRYFGVSSHDPRRKELLLHAIDTGLFDAILVAFNSFDYERSGMPHLLAYAHQNDIGVIGMEESAGKKTMHVPNVNPITAELAWMLSKEIHTVIHSQTVFNEDSQDACLAAAALRLPPPVLRKPI